MHFFPKKKKCIFSKTKSDRAKWFSPFDSSSKSSFCKTEKGIAYKITKIAHFFTQNPNPYLHKTTYCTKETHPQIIKVYTPGVRPWLLWNANPEEIKSTGPKMNSNKVWSPLHHRFKKRS